MIKKHVSDEMLKKTLISLITQHACGVPCVANYACRLELNCNTALDASNSTEWEAMRERKARELFIEMFGKKELLKVVL